MPDDHDHDHDEHPDLGKALAAVALIKAELGGPPVPPWHPSFDVPPPYREPFSYHPDGAITAVQFSIVALERRVAALEQLLSALATR